MSSDAQHALLTPGADGTLIPAGLRLIRMANQPKLANLSPEAARLVQDGKALPSFFDLSSEDKKQSVPRLSVWIETLTTVAQVWVLVGANPIRRWTLSLEADRVRAIFAKAFEKLPPTPLLEVHWERATVQTETGERIPDTRPGWEGHAGIANLDKGNKTQRDSLRWQLAELAAVRILTEEEITTFSEASRTPPGPVAGSQPDIGS